ncbi:MAG TPA: BrnT family toxin [Candidatus Acidoferrum sp.]|jgi:uncharacterized DUF497 family protein
MVWFEWDEAKAQSNERKHRVRFDDAILAFADPFVLIRRHPPSFRTQQADAFSSHFTSCEMVGLRREKSLFVRSVSVEGTAAIARILCAEISLILRSVIQEGRQTL